MSRKIYLLPLGIIVGFISLGLLLPNLYSSKYDNKTLNNIKYESVNAKPVDSNPLTSEILYVMSSSSKNEDPFSKNISEVDVNLEENKGDIINNFYTQMGKLEAHGFNISNYFSHKLDPKNLTGKLYNVTYKGKTTSKFYIWDVKYEDNLASLNFTYNPLSGIVYTIDISAKKTYTKQDGEKLLSAFSEYLGLENMKIKEASETTGLLGVFPDCDYKVHCHYGEGILGISHFRY